MSISQKLFETSFPEWWFGPKAVKDLDSMVVGQKKVLYKGKDVMVKLQWDRNDKKYLTIHMCKPSADKDSIPYWYYRKYEIVMDAVEDSKKIRNTNKALKLIKRGKYPGTMMGE